MAKHFKAQLNQHHCEDGTLWGSTSYKVPPSIEFCPILCPTTLQFCHCCNKCHPLPAPPTHPIQRRRWWPDKIATLECQPFFLLSIADCLYTSCGHCTQAPQEVLGNRKIARAHLTWTHRNKYYIFFCFWQVVNSGPQLCPTGRIPNDNKQIACETQE
jgi:hypothetical protein